MKSLDDDGREFMGTYVATRTHDLHREKDKHWAEEAEDEDEDDVKETEEELDGRMKEFEELMDRRPFLVNDVLLRRNPNDVQEWEKRVALWGENDEKVRALFSLSEKKTRP